MIYRSFKDKKISALGFGTMRLPLKNGNFAEPDEDAAAVMFDTAIKGGVNYFDTAWGYHDGAAETVTGNLLSAYPRDGFFLADKFPGYDLANIDKVTRIFPEQLKKCRVDHFDFYLFHNVCEVNINAYLDDSHGIYDYLKEQKKNGRIRHLGFSVHGEQDVLQRFLDKYADVMEFCQVQLNYLDWEFQHADEKVKKLQEYNIPLWVMEPLRGGRLANLRPDEEKTLKNMRPDERIPAWAFRFLFTIPSVKVILSGMSDLDQVKDNLRTFSEEKALTEAEMSGLLSLARSMYSSSVLPCTACRYCTSHCPKHLDIPELLRLYNEHKFTGGGFLAPMALSAMPADKQPRECIGCRSCEKVCPQNIKISEAMRNFTEILG